MVDQEDPSFPAVPRRSSLNAQKCTCCLSRLFCWVTNEILWSSSAAFRDRWNSPKNVSQIGVCIPSEEIVCFVWRDGTTEEQGWCRRTVLAYAETAPVSFQKRSFTTIADVRLVLFSAVREKYHSNTFKRSQRWGWIEESFVLLFFFNTYISCKAAQLQVEKAVYVPGEKNIRILWYMRRGPTCPANGIYYAAKVQVPLCDTGTNVC